MWVPGSTLDDTSTPEEPMGRFPAATFVAAALMSVVAFPAIAWAGWTHVDNVDGVDVYERSPRHLGEQALRTVVEIDAPIGKVVSVFANPEERTNWVDRLADQKMLQVDGDTDDAWMERYWERIDMPFGVSDRDYVVAKAYRFEPDERKLTARIRSIDDDRVPERDCCVRAKSLMQYTVEAIPGQHRTRVELVAEVDLGGNLSSGPLVRRNARDWPVKTLRGLADRAESNAVEVDERVVDWHEE